MKTITTVEQLEALPEGAIIRDRYQTLGELTGDGWQFPCSKDIKPSRVALPATLLHPLILDAADVERAAEALHKHMHLGESLRSSTSGYRESVRGQARAALGTVGRVEA